MGMDEIGVPRAKYGAYSTRSGEVPISAHPDCRGCDSSRSEATDERRIWCCDHEWLVTLLTLTACEEIDLALSTAPLSAGVQVQNAKRLGRCRHAERMGAAASIRNARNSRAQCWTDLTGAGC